MKRRVAWSVFFGTVLYYVLRSTQVSKCFAQNKDSCQDKNIGTFVSRHKYATHPKKYHRRQTWQFGMKGLQQIEKDVPRT